MNFCPKKILVSFALVLTPLVVVTPTFAAAPDGAGPWADSVLSSSQGMMKNGAAVPAIRSNTSSTLGVAENNTTEGNFFSLGFGGNIALGFDNGISSGVILVEATNPGYPVEKAKVEVSENGTTWVNAGEVSQGGTVNKPTSISCAKYVRITDISNPNDFGDATADGYDVDGVKATGEPCTPPTGGGNGSGGSGDCKTDIKQTNKTNITLNIGSTTNTGKNKANGNTNGNTTVKTGDATSNTTVGIVAGSNTATGGCCCGGDTNVTISGNGAGSTNTVNINSNSKKTDKKAKKDK